MPVTIIQLEVSNTYLKKKRYVPAKTSHFSVVAKKLISEIFPNKVHGQANLSVACLEHDGVIFILTI